MAPMIKSDECAVGGLAVLCCQRSDSYGENGDQESSWIDFVVLRDERAVTTTTLLSNARSRLSARHNWSSCVRGR